MKRNQPGKAPLKKKLNFIFLCNGFWSIFGWLLYIESIITPKPGFTWLISFYRIVEKCLKFHPSGIRSMSEEENDPKSESESKLFWIFCGLVKVVNSASTNYFLKIKFKKFLNFFQALKYLFMWDWFLCIILLRFLVLQIQVKCLK